MTEQDLVSIISSIHGRIGVPNHGTIGLHLRYPIQRDGERLENQGMLDVMFASVQLAQVCISIFNKREPMDRHSWCIDRYLECMEAQHKLTGRRDSTVYGNPRYGEEIYEFLPPQGSRGIFDPERDALNRALRDGRQRGWWMSHKKMTRDGRYLNEVYQVSRNEQGHRH